MTVIHDKLPSTKIQVGELLLSSDSESEDEVVTQRGKKLSEKRRRENILFSAWEAQQGTKITEKESIQATQTAHNADDEFLSVQGLMAKTDSAKIIASPRDYQVDLCERAKKQNTIAVLDTGSGKTHIAVLLLQHTLDIELENRRLGVQPKVAFFLVHSVALVFQQHTVLDKNLRHNVARFCGDMGCDLWHRDVWSRHFKDNMVIVCTAEILQSCLMHSFISLEQINLLIFDEAHHAKKNHAYARIMKDFYLAEADASKRPKIFGMTASPVDAREDVVKAAKGLETLLQSRIATAADLSMLRQTISRPVEQVISYESLEPQHLTSFGAEMKARFGDLTVLKKLFKTARSQSSQLGDWCADQVWSVAFNDEEQQGKITRKVQRQFRTEKSTRPIAELDAELARVQEAKAFVQQHVFSPQSLRRPSISPKVLRLSQYLKLIYERNTTARCIVFVKERYTARLLLNLFESIGTAHMHMGLLIGTRSSCTGDQKLSFRDQILTLAKFREGKINCLFATSIAEEGIDIPECNRIIRFDLYDTMIQYIQSRGRARHSQSQYIHMIEEGNKIHIQALGEVRQGEHRMKQFCEALPADRLLQGNDTDLDITLSKEKKLRKYVDPSTGATLNYHSSLAILAHFVGCLPNHEQTSDRACFLMMLESRYFKCEVVMPENSPIRSAIGKPASRKAIAKRSAAFEMCLQLRMAGYLDANLLPIYQKYLPALRNAHLALNSNKSNTYAMRAKPALWERSKSRGAVPKKLYLTVFQLDDPSSLGRDYQPIGLLSRTQLPNLPPITLYPQADTTSEVLSTSIRTPLDVDDHVMFLLNAFTLRIYLDIFNKRYEDNISSMSYWIAPIRTNLSISDSVCQPADLIDVDILNYVYEHEEEDTLRWSPGIPSKDLLNRYFVDKWDGGRRFYSMSILSQLSPQSPVPTDAAKGRWMDTILDYSVSLFAKSRLRAQWVSDQPVLLAHKVLHRLNVLDIWPEKEKNVNTVAYICPEPLKISALPVSVVSMGYLFPAIITRVESYLIALEACETLDLTINPALALEALTKDSDNIDEHQAGEIHVQRGMGKNYERLEFIGDCFLKMATTITVFSKSPNNDEFAYHCMRMGMICNKNLQEVAIQNKLYEYIRTMGFSRRTWYPQGIKLLEGKGHNKTGLESYSHRLGDKTIADVCEALIGAALLSCRDTGDMDMAVKAVSAMVSNADHDVQCWSDYYALYTKPDYLLVEASAPELDVASKLEKVHPYHFRYPRLLYSAFVHPSYPSAWSRDVPSYQRLEFLGDSLLDMASISFLFFKHLDKDPQWLTEHKMAMVSNKFLAALAVELGFHRFLLKNSPAIEFQVREFAVEIDELKKESQGARDFWTLTKNPPKCLSDIVESYIGAVFVDSQYQYTEVERFFDYHVRWYFEDVALYDTFANNHPTTHLHQLLTNSYGCRDYRVMAKDVNAGDGSTPLIVAVVMIHEEIMAHATASSGKYAKVKACKAALELLGGLAPFEYRAKYHCDCEKQLGEVKDGLDERVGTAV